MDEFRSPVQTEGSEVSLQEYGSFHWLLSKKVLLLLSAKKRKHIARNLRQLQKQL